MPKQTVTNKSHKNNEDKSLKMARHEEKNPANDIIKLESTRSMEEVSSPNKSS